MKTILFATGNERKVGEAKAACNDFDIKVEQLKLQINEIQSHDPMEISKHKAKEAFRLSGKPVVITDTSWNIPALNGFPGGYMKDVAEWFSPGDFINLINQKDDRRISFTETIIYKDKDLLKVFSNEYWGKLAAHPAGSGNSIEQVAEFDGFTIGQRREQGGFSHKPEDYIWYDFARWYSS